MSLSFLTTVTTVCRNGFDHITTSWYIGFDHTHTRMMLYYMFGFVVNNNNNNNNKKNNFSLENDSDQCLNKYMGTQFGFCPITNESM